MTLKAQDDRLSMIINYASDIVSGIAKTDLIIEMLDYFRRERDFFLDWYGKDSKQFAISNAVLNLARLLERSITESHVLISDWVKDKTVRKQWIIEIEISLQS